ncbi:MAG: DUF3298 domain-containing protein [Clostridia bacterium]|nr:DUF3298 domain-containing protein [Clostridia bacterium]
MKKLLTLIMAMILCLPTLVCAAPLQLQEDLAGQVIYPEGASQAEAVFTFTYAYPQFQAEYDSDESINDDFAYMHSDMLNFTAPLLYQAALDTADAVTSNTVSYQITRNDDEYLSVLFYQEQMAGASPYETWTAYVYARQGDAAGKIVTLPEILGTQDPLEEDEKVIERACRKANEMVCTLVWEIIEEQMDAGEGSYYEGLTPEDLAAEFYPESDFYLDGDGNLIFFIQPGMIASEAAGHLVFPFSLEELLNEL